MQMNLTEEEIEQITLIESAQSILFPHIRKCVAEYGPYITQYALDFFICQLNRALKEKEEEWKSHGKPA
jgi:preprotein translocase subunit SecB